MSMTSNAKEVETKIKGITPKFLQQTKKIINVHGRILASHIREKYMTGGTTSTKTAVRSGDLRASTKALPIEQKPGIINGGVGIGPLAYARVHIGPKGQVTTIKSDRSGGWLTIPQNAAKTKAGVTRGKAKSRMWGETKIQRGEFDGGTFIQKSGGKPYIFGKRVIQKGKRAGQTRGKIVPLFLLVRQVKVKARIHPEKILPWSRDKIIDDFKEIGLEMK